MSHQGVLNPEFTYTPLRDGSGTVTSITVACTMYSAPLIEIMEERTAVSGNIDPGPEQTSLYGVTVTDEANKVELGYESFNWTVPTNHRSTADPYVVDWKWQADRTEDNQTKLIHASTDFKNMMFTLYALQITHND